MPNDSFTNALKEAYALTSYENVVLDTLTIEHRKFYPIYLVKGSKDRLLTLEDGRTVKFKAAGFAFTMPVQGGDGVSEVNITIDNAGIVVEDLIAAISQGRDKVEVTYRPYLEGHPDAPEIDPPYRFTMTDIVVDEKAFSGRATLRDMVNKKFPSDMYVRSRFPSLGD